MTRFYKQRRSFMTLLETLIAISLLSVVLVFVFGIFRELAEVSRLTDSTQKESFQMRYVESRLGFIFERIVNENSGTTRTFFFYTQPPERNRWLTTSLILTFNNEVRLDPHFSGDVLARLYVDSDHSLRLAIWPLYVEDPYEFLQEEILLENVADVKFSFYVAPERIQNNKEIHSGKQIDPEKKMPEKDTWHEDEWAITYEQMPAILKMTVEVAKDPKDLASHHPGMRIATKPLTFSFVLPSSKNPVQYPPQSKAS